MSDLPDTFPEKWEKRIAKLVSDVVRRSGGFSPVAGGRKNLADLNDIIISSLTDNDVLQYDSGSAAWLNSQDLDIDGDLDVTSHDGAAAGLSLGGTLVTSTAAELNFNDITTPGTAEASKALIVDGSKNITGIGTIASGNITILSAAPILVFKDSDGAGSASTGFIEWRDSGGGRAGFFGNSSSGNDDLLWKNEQDGNIKIETTGAGEFQIFANTVLGGVQAINTTVNPNTLLNIGGLKTISGNFVALTATPLIITDQASRTVSGLVLGIVVVGGGHDINLLAGVTGSIGNTQNITITEANAVTGTGLFTNGTIDTFRCLNAREPTGASNITDLYGLFVGDICNATGENFAIKTGLGDVSFGGNTSIVTTSGIPLSLHQDNASAAEAVQKLTQDDIDQAIWEVIGSVSKFTTATISTAGTVAFSDIDNVAAPNALVWENNSMLQINLNGTKSFIPIYTAV